MTARDRVKRYRETGGAADLVRVEVLVPQAGRDAIVSAASRLREEHRAEQLRLRGHLERALELYGSRLTDNIDLERAGDLRSRARIVANALMERGDARAYVIGRQMLAELGS